ncbi:hypothetical protein FHR71_002519 [Methylobacterium sp. RAS18]|nr:hypothetical protein [Methylobacterium sp. RAS18]
MTLHRDGWTLDFNRLPLSPHAGRGYVREVEAVHRAEARGYLSNTACKAA